jgi:hypothetical protein
LPLKFVSDRDPKFTSKIWKSLFKDLFGSELAMSTPYHPQTDGLVERLNLTLKEMLRAFSDNASKDWDVYLPAAEFVYNSTYNTSVHDIPFRLDCGQIPLDHHGIAVAKILENQSEQSLDYEFKYDGTAVEFMTDWNDSLTLARQCLEEAGEKMRDQYEKLRDDVAIGTFKVGDMVNLDGRHLKVVDTTGKMGARKALDKRRLGPYKILEIIGDGTAFRLELPPYQKFHPVQPISRIELIKESSEFPLAHTEVPHLPVILGSEENAHEEFEIEKIIRHKTVRGNRYYLVKWLGHDEFDWKLESDLQNASEVLHDYKLNHGMLNVEPPRRSQRILETQSQT